MRRFALRMLISALGLWVASAIVPGFEVTGLWTLVGAAFLLGLVNAIVKPILVLLTLPITVLTLGIFLLVINAAMIGLVAALLENFRITGFVPALLGWLVVTFTGWIASWFVGPRGRVHVTYTRHR